MKFEYVKEELWKELAIDFAKRWLSHDGLWFQAAEKAHGIEEAIRLDIEAWEKQTVLEAKRIMSLLKMEAGGGLDALEQCLKYRMYAFINDQEIIRISDKILIFYMRSCRVQAAREKKNLEFFPCKPVGIVEYSKFAQTIDGRIKTRCIGCPPDVIPGKQWHCSWEFSIV